MRLIQKHTMVIETDALFDVIDHTQTAMGRMVLYRALSHPVTSAYILQQKQDTLRELESNPDLFKSLQNLVDNSILGEESLNNLLYGEFVGGLATDEPIDGDKKLEFGGYGYNQYNDGTRFAIELVNAVNKLSQPTSSYLTELFSAVRSFGESQTCALMRGPVYPTGNQFKTQRERNTLIPTLRFHPSLLKLSPMLIFAASVYGIHYIRT